MNDPAKQPAEEPSDKSAFTKEPQPELPLDERRKKAGLTRNRVAIWVIVGGFALYLIITGIVGILTKAR
jgi:hypothetical protein